MPEKNPLENQSKLELLAQEVGKVLDIEGLKLGGTQDPYHVQYFGQLKLPSEVAYDQLSTTLLPLGFTALFRRSEDKHLIIIKRGLISAVPGRKGINALLFVITFISILLAGLLTSYTGPETDNLGVIWAHLTDNLGPALAFTFSMLGILTTHEFGHYFAARYHGTTVTLPYFIPFPLSPFGTMGAFIRMLEPPKNKKVLLDIGLAGPLAGLVVAIPILIKGLSLSRVDVLPAVLPEGLFFEGNSILYLVLKYLVHGSWLPKPLSYGSLPPLLYWVEFFFTGKPLPLGGVDVMIHPMAWAGWAGLLITSLNLLPVGQLDGGHLIYSLFGDRGKWIRPVVVIVLFALGFLWSGWWVWVFIILLLGNRRAEPLDEITELNPLRKAVAILGLVIFFLIFMPVPIISI
jgi:hypothetical protein